MSERSEVASNDSAASATTSPQISNRGDRVDRQSDKSDASVSSSTKSNVEKELRSLKAQMRGMQIILQQNAELEKEVQRLNRELDVVTHGVQMKGYIYKWREREIYYATRWGLRYFVLQGKMLSYYGDDKELRPRRTLDLSNCFVRDEGPKKGGIYHVFSIYLDHGGGVDDSNGDEDDDADDDRQVDSSSLLLRLSTESAAEAALWMDMLEQGCAFSDEAFSSLHDEDNAATTPGNSEHYSKIGNAQDDTNATAADDETITAAASLRVSVPVTERKPDYLSVEFTGKMGTVLEQPLGGGGGGDDWNHFVGSSSHSHLPELQSQQQLSEPQELADVDKDLLSPVMLQRVQSSSLVLEMSKAKQKQTVARQVLASRAPQNFTASGNRISQYAQQQLAAATSATGGRRNNSSTAAASTGSSKANKAFVKGHRAFPGYKPMHTHSQSSPLSNDTDSKVHNFRGFFNLAVIILVLSHCDLIANNLSRYGLKVSLPSIWYMPELEHYKTEFAETAPYLSNILLAMFTWVGSILLAFSVEQMAYWGRYPEQLILAVNILLGIANIVVPTALVWYSKAHPGLNLMYLFQSAVIWMKLISYAHANRDLRIAHRTAKRYDRELSGGGNGTPTASAHNSRADLHTSGSGVGDLSPPRSPHPFVRSRSFSDNNAKPFSGDQLQIMLAEVKDVEPPFVFYPMNLTLINLLYFMVVPTLCYQLNYPRTAKIRTSHVLSLVFRMLLTGLLLVFSVEQYIRPTLETSLEPMQDRNLLLIFERLLKLSIPNTYVWLLGFYLYFHLWLNLLAELTRFGDREFYKEWWNARTVDSYWRLWNLPVHHWITRHMYYPLLSLGVSRTWSIFISFFFSAVMHELIISVPFRYIAFHAFAGMMLQMPLIFVTKYIDRRFDNPFIGNAMFWCAFCVIGQPMGIIMYHYDLWKLGDTPSATGSALQ